MVINTTLAETTIYISSKYSIQIHMYLLVWGKNQCKALACISALVAVTNTVELIHGSEIADRKVSLIR